MMGKILSVKFGAGQGFAMGIEGLDELRETLTKLEMKIVHEAQVAAMNEIGPLLVEEAASNLPQHWILRKSLAFNIRERKNKVDIIVGPSREQEYNGQNPGHYGRWQEFGYGAAKGIGKTTGKNNWGKWLKDPSNRKKRPTEPKRYARTAFKKLKETILDIIREKTVLAVKEITAKRTEAGTR